MRRLLLRLRLSMLRRRARCELAYLEDVLYEARVSAIMSRMALEREIRELEAEHENIRSIERRAAALRDRL